MTEGGAGATQGEQLAAGRRARPRLRLSIESFWPNSPITSLHSKVSVSWLFSRAESRKPRPISHGTAIAPPVGPLPCQPG